MNRRKCALEGHDWVTDKRRSPSTLIRVEKCSRWFCTARRVDPRLKPHLRDMLEKWWL